MTGSDLLYAIGELDDSLIERAGKKPVFTGKRMVPVISAAAAACFVFILLNSVHRPPSDSESAVTISVAPMIYVQSRLYMIAGDIDGGQADYSETDPSLTYIGEIRSSVDSDEEPHRELQSNDAIIGARVYQHGQDLVVFYQNRCDLYHPYGTGN